MIERPAPLLPPGRTFGVVGAGVMGRTILKGLFDTGVLERSSAWGIARTARTCEAASGVLGIPVTTEVGSAPALRGCDRALRRACAGGARRRVTARGWPPT